MGTGFLLDLVLKLLNLDNIQGIVATILIRILPDAEDEKGCREQLLKWLKDGKLDDMFEEDPICVVLCVAYVGLAIAAKMHGHDHTPDVTSDGDLITGEPSLGAIGEDEFATYCADLAHYVCNEDSVLVTSRGYITQSGLFHLLMPLIQLFLKYIKELDL